LWYPSIYDGGMPWKQFRQNRLSCASLPAEYWFLLLVVLFCPSLHEQLHINCPIGNTSMLGIIAPAKEYTKTGVVMAMVVAY